MRKTGRMSDAFVKAINDLNEEAFQLLYGRWDPLEPERVADLAAAHLDPEGRAWLAQTLEMLGHHSWAQLVTQ
jgi:hypothetical protein